MIYMAAQLVHFRQILLRHLLRMRGEDEGSVSAKSEDDGLLA
jgi:hypothetical protein